MVPLWSPLSITKDPLNTHRPNCITCYLETYTLILITIDIVKSIGSILTSFLFAMSNNVFIFCYINSSESSLKVLGLSIIWYHESQYIDSTNWKWLWLTHYCEVITSHDEKSYSLLKKMHRNVSWLDQVISHWDNLNVSFIINNNSSWVL